MSDIFEDISYAYIELNVGMAKMVTYWHIKALGFELKAYRGPETGFENELSFLIHKNGIYMMITSAASPTAYDILSFVDRHGNGVRRLAFRVANVEKAFQTAIERGAIPTRKPEMLQDEFGVVHEAAIKLLDLKEIVFFNGDDYQGILMPGFRAHSITGFEPDFDNGFKAVDHIAYGLHYNEMSFWCDQYFKRIFGGEIVQDIRGDDVITEYSGLLLRLLSNEERTFNHVFVEPQNRRKASQVQEYLEAYLGSGIQHMAFATDDIFSSVKHMRRMGVDFVSYPPSYYEMMREKGEVPKDLIDKIQDANLLCDAIDGSYLFQTFTKPFGDRPTLFYEVIQRTDGYDGFALDNITELFKAVEREQEKREQG